MPQIVFSPREEMSDEITQLAPDLWPRFRDIAALILNLVEELANVDLVVNGDHNQGECETLHDPRVIMTHIETGCCRFSVFVRPDFVAAWHGFINSALHGYPLRLTTLCSTVRTLIRAQARVARYEKVQALIRQAVEAFESIELGLPIKCRVSTLRTDVYAQEIKVPAQSVEGTLAELVDTHRTELTWALWIEILSGQYKDSQGYFIRKNGKSNSYFWINGETIAIHHINRVRIVLKPETPIDRVRPAISDAPNLSARSPAIDDCPFDAIGFLRSIYQETRGSRCPEDKIRAIEAILEPIEGILSPTETPDL